MFAKSSPTVFIFVLLTFLALIIGSLGSDPSPAPKVYAVPQPSLATTSLASSIDNVSISGQCIISILHASETGGPVVPVSQESNSFKDCGVNPSFISSTTTGPSSTLTTTSTISSTSSQQTLSSSAPSSSASIVSSTSSVSTSAPSGSNAGSPQISSIQSIAISSFVLPCILAFALHLL